jgi:hypothetical protein
LILSLMNFSCWSRSGNPFRSSESQEFRSSRMGRADWGVLAFSPPPVTPELLYYYNVVFFCSFIFLAPSP